MTSDRCFAANRITTGLPSLQYFAPELRPLAKQLSAHFPSRMSPPAAVENVQMPKVDSDANYI